MADELYGRRFVWVLLFEMHYQAKRPVLKWGVGWTDDHSVPTRESQSGAATNMGPFGHLSYQVMTLSGTGDAETPAGGSVCMRCERREFVNQMYRWFWVAGLP